MTVVANLAPALVVSHDKHDVGSFRGRGFAHDGHARNVEGDHQPTALPDFRETVAWKMHES